MKIVPRSEWLVWGCVALLLLLGMGLRWLAEDQVRLVQVDGSQLAYPAGWTMTTEFTSQFSATDARQGPFGPQVSLMSLPGNLMVGQGSRMPAEEVAASWPIVRSRDLVGYRVLQIEPQLAAGRQGLSIWYVYLDDPPPGAASAPGLMYAIDTLVGGAERFYVLTTAVEAANRDQLSLLHQRFLDEWMVP